MWPLFNASCTSLRFTSFMQFSLIFITMRVVLRRSLDLINFKLVSNLKYNKTVMNIYSKDFAKLRPQATLLSKNTGTHMDVTSITTFNAWFIAYRSQTVLHTELIAHSFSSLHITGFLPYKIDCPALPITTWHNITIMPIVVKMLFKLWLKSYDVASCVTYT